MNKGTAKKSSSSHRATGLKQAASIAGFLEMAFDAAVAFDSRERITHWNSAAEQMFGWTAQEVLGKTPAELFGSASTPQEQKGSWSRLKPGEILRGEQAPYGKDGSSLWVQSAVRAIFDADQKIIGYLAIYRDISAQKQDITEREQTDEQLERSNQKLNEILTSIQDDFYVLDHDWVFVYANRQFTSKIGKEPQDFIGKNIWRMFPKHVGTTFEENLRAAMEKRQIRRFEIPGKYTNAWYRMTASPSEEGITVLGTDITDRRQAEEALRASEQRLRQMIETSPVAIGFGDSTGKIFGANTSFYRLTGYSREEIEASQIGWNQLTAPEYAEIDRQIMTTLDATGSAGPYEKEYIRKDGSRVPLILTVSKLPGRDEHIAFIIDITERKRAEQAVRESQRKYQDLIETTSDFIWETNSQGKYTYCSPQMEKLWGIKPEDMIGKMPFDVMPPQEREGALEYFEDVIRSAAPFSGLTTTAVNSQGNLFYVETSGVPFFDHNGKLLGFRGITRDVTERNRTRRQIFEANQRLLALMNALPVGVSFSDDPTCQHITGNPAALAQFEVGSGDNLSASAPDSSAPGRQVKFFRDGKQITDVDLPLQRAVAENREIPPMEFEVHLPSGRRWWALGSGAPICDQDGNVIGGVAVTQDVTVRKHGEEQLRELSQRLTYHVDNSPLAVIEWGPDMRLIRWSGTAEQIFGWKAEEVLGKRMEDFPWIYEEDKPRVGDVSTDLRTGTNSQRFSANRNYRKDGSVVYCEWYNSSLMHESGKLRSILSLVLDVTDRKRAEEALLENQEQLQSLNETLEQKVHEKTEEVHHLASDVIQAVQHERHRISHILHDDLQQRIYAIQMQLTLLHDELQREKESARKEVADVEQQLAEILTVTRRLSIDLSPPILRDEGLAHAIDWLAAQMRQRYGLSIELQADEPFAIPDEALHVLLFNCVRELLFNVVKHAQASRAIVTLKWVDTDLLIEVRDDGKGFQVKALEQQSNREVSEEDHPQSGFGLTTIRYQLSLFGGYMEVHSEPGAGTRVIMIVSAPEAEQKT